LKALIVSALVFLACFSNVAKAFGTDEKWVSGWGQGISEAIITRGPGNNIYVTCGNSEVNRTGISFMLRGRGPKGSSVQLTFDGSDPENYSIWTNSSMSIPSFCHACSGTYQKVIEKFKSHRTVHVKFENGDAAKFTLKGASDAIGDCVPDFWK